MKTEVRTMKTSAETMPPRIETLLVSAYQDLDVLRERRGALLRSGVDNDHLPDELVLMAFALLGDHERVKLLDQVRTHWSDLQSKGLAQGAIDVAATAELRLLAHALPHTKVIGNVWERLKDAKQATEPPHGILRCATRVRGLWGQLARLHFSAQDVQHMVIAPDRIFGLQPALITAEPGRRLAGNFVIPIDNGEIAITLLHRSGEVFRHVVQAMVEEVA